MEKTLGWLLVGSMCLLCGFLLYVAFSGTLTARQARGWAAHLLAPGYSECHRCKMPWKFTKSHTTDYGPIGEWQDNGQGIKVRFGPMGCFPLCERCWTELKTPEARMPYYRQLWAEWSNDGVGNGDRKWEWIEAAVRDGR